MVDPGKEDVGLPVAVLAEVDIGLPVALTIGLPVAVALTEVATATECVVETKMETVYVIESVKSDYVYLLLVTEQTHVPDMLTKPYLLG